MSDWLELHDSRLVAMEHLGAMVRLWLDGYVHRWELAAGGWLGTGWARAVKITMDGVTTPVVSLKLPVEIAGGVLQYGNINRDNALPLPLATSQAASLRLQIAADEGEFRIDGRGLRIEAEGEARFIENLPADLRPNAD
jgi:hypothetical protein